MRGVVALSVRIDEQVLRIDDVLLRHAAESIEPGPPSLGAVTGVLFRYNDLELTAGIRDPFRGDQVQVRFPRALAASVRANLTNTVRIWGEVHRDRVGKRVAIVVDHIDLVEEASTSRPASEIAGLFIPDARPGVDSVSWQRRQRNG
jgi:hypothetical protein